MRCHFVALALCLVMLVGSVASAQVKTLPPPKLPEPFATPSATKFVKVIGWPEDRTPTAPKGFQVTAIAEKIESPRWIYVLPNGDVLVAQSRTLPKPEKLDAENKAEPKDAAKKAKEKQVKEGMKKSKTITGTSPNQITLLRDADGDGKFELREVFLKDLNQPLGMAILKDTLYIANTDAVLTFPYREGDTKIGEPGKKIINLPAGGYNNHWTRNILFNADGSKLYISVGSASNVAETQQKGEMTARSHHAGCVTLLLCDGSVRLIRETIEPTAWRALATRAGGEFVQDEL